MFSHTLKDAPSSEYPWMSTTGLRAIGANILRSHRGGGSHRALYICPDGPAVFTDACTSRAGHVAVRVPEARLRRDRLDRRLPGVAREVAGPAAGPARRP